MLDGISTTYGLYVFQAAGWGLGRPTVPARRFRFLQRDESQESSRSCNVKSLKQEPKELQYQHYGATFQEYIRYRVPEIDIKMILESV